MTLDATGSGCHPTASSSYENASHWRDGLSLWEPVKTIVETLGVSAATAYRVLAED